MEAAIRSAYYFLTKKQPSDELLKLEAVRGMAGVRKAELVIQNIPLKVAVIHGTDNARKFLHHLNVNKEHFDFVEVMTCPGGCISGGGRQSISAMIWMWYERQEFRHCMIKTAV